jgi:transposase-like protein
MSGKRRRRTYDKAFKYEAVRLVLEEGRSAAEVEEQELARCVVAS